MDRSVSTIVCAVTLTKVADPPCSLTQSQDTDTGPTSPSTDSAKTGVWQGSHFSANFFLCDWYDSTGELTDLSLLRLLFVGRLKSQQHASVSQGWICSDNCHTEIEIADQTFYLTKSQYTDTGLTSPSPDPITPGTWQGTH